MILRVLQSVAVVFTAATLAFVLLHLAPGDAATALGEGVAPEVRAAIRTQYGLDDSLATQYGRWLSSLLRGDLGYSRDQHRPVAAVLGDALPRSLFLMGCALSVSLVGGMLIGAWQGVRAGSRRDRTTSTALLVLYSLPEFWLALLLLVVFSHQLGWLPATGITSETYDYMTPGDQLWDRLCHLVLPLVSLSLIGVSVFARYQRDAMQESMAQAFVRTARAKGLPEAGVRRQAWRNALLPVITVTGLMLPALMTGAVFVERVFSWPGMGFAMIRAIEARDYQVVSAGVILGSAVTAVGAALADIARDIADPRLRSQ
ncbi:ABC transporter permease [Gemmatimonas sp.]|uniref:ABC transporter permease n=1 Tax=Gemmatimonas sp. TaxID=1962908 RepID=UPI00286CBB4A|nr:ABC transporter permease [Gemmatimonas sp.]